MNSHLGSIPAGHDDFILRRGNQEIPFIQGKTYTPLPTACSISGGAEKEQFRAHPSGPLCASVLQPCPGDGEAAFGALSPAFES